MAGVRTHCKPHEHEARARNPHIFESSRELSTGIESARDRGVSMLPLNLASSVCLPRKAEVVVARYNEDVGWLQPLADELRLNVSLYNKGPALQGIGASWHIERLQNVGRECSSYLHHIVRRYLCLAEFTVFLQGNPFLQCFDLSPALRQLLPGGRHTTLGYTSVCPSDGVGQALGRLSSKDGRPDWQMRSREKSETGRITDKLWDDTLRRTGFTGLRDVSWTAFAGAQFVVNRRAVHRRPVEFYAHLLRQLVHNETGVLTTSGHEACHVFERLWPLIFL
jgi:hypothetical protein